MASEEASLILQPLDSHEFITTLRTYRKMLSSCIGPGGGIKIIVTAANYSTFTSSSSRLLNNITIENPVCMYINQIIKTQINSYYNDFGLYSGVFITSLLEKILSRDTGLSMPATVAILEFLNTQLKEILDLEILRLKVDFSTVKQLLPLVKSVLLSKPLCSLPRNEAIDLEVNIVKGFLQTIGKSIGKVFVECSECTEMKSEIFPGILYQINLEDTMILNKKSKKKNLTLLIFNIMLTEEDNMKISEYRSVKIEGSRIKNNFIEEALSLFVEIVKLDVDVVACQKVVHPSLCLYLQRKGVLVLERLGTDLTLALEALSGATSISSIKHCPPNKLNEFIGRIDTVKLVEYGQKRYVSLENAGGTIATLLTHALTEEAATELKVVIKQCLSTLNNLMSNPEVIPGAGCFEMSLAIHLLKQVRSKHESGICTRSQLETFVNWIQRALLSASGISNENSSLLTVDTVFGHLWKADEEKCCCRLVTSRMVTASKSGTWVHVFQNEGLSLSQDAALFVNLSPKPLVIKEEAIIDLFNSKRNAINVSFETCVNLLGVGMIVYKPKKC